MAVATIKPYTAGGDEETDPYRNDGTSQAIGDNTSAPAVYPGASTDSTTRTTGTFADLQNAGQARPPMPPSLMIANNPENEGEGGIPSSPTSPPQLVPTAPPAPPPAAPPALPPTTPPPGTPPTVGVPPGAATVPPPNPPPTGPALPPVTPPLVPLNPPQLVPTAPLTPPPPTTPPTTPTAPKTPVDATTSADLIALLLKGTKGDNGTPLSDALTQTLTKQLSSSSPYDSKQVADEYKYLSGNIDDSFDTQQRNLDNEMAKRGLWGSLGKDVASGRASDLNVGRRTAKETLAEDLAHQYATTAGTYQQNAITDAQAATNAANANQQNWLKSLIGYGNDAFSHDLLTAQFNQGQSVDYQQLLNAMLAAGYGA